MKWYENHRHNWSYCHDLRFWISFYFLCGWEAVEYGETPPFCVYAICHSLFSGDKMVPINFIPVDETAVEVDIKRNVTSPSVCDVCGKTYNSRGLLYKLVVGLLQRSTLDLPLRISGMIF